MSDRRLWIDTTGEAVITTTPNGTRNARRWGWTEAQAVPIDDADHEKAVRERIARALRAEVWPIADERTVVDRVLEAAAQIVQEGA